MDPSPQKAPSPQRRWGFLKGLSLQKDLSLQKGLSPQKDPSPQNDSSLLAASSLATHSLHSNKSTSLLTPRSTQCIKPPQPLGEVLTWTPITGFELMLVPITLKPAAILDTMHQILLGLQPQAQSTYCFFGLMQWAAYRYDMEPDSNKKKGIREMLVQFWEALPKWKLQLRERFENHWGDGSNFAFYDILFNLFQSLRQEVVVDVGRDVLFTGVLLRCWFCENEDHSMFVGSSRVDVGCMRLEVMGKTDVMTRCFPVKHLHLTVKSHGHIKTAEELFPMDSTS
jgi:hypothetical protein